MAWHTSDSVVQAPAVPCGTLRWEDARGICGPSADGLFTALACIFRCRQSRTVRAAGSILLAGVGVRVGTLFALATKHLLLQPYDLGLQRLNLLALFRDGSRLFFRQRFPLQSLFLPRRFSLTGARMLHSPVMGLLTQIDRRLIKGNVLNVHAP